MFVVTSMQLEPHLVRPAPQLVPHTELEQTCPLGHALPHAPQFIASEVMLTHAVPHFVKPAAHWHTPAVHVWPVVHAVVHEPQCASSVCRSTHAPEHEVSPPEQPALPASDETEGPPPPPGEADPPVPAEGVPLL